MNIIDDMKTWGDGGCILVRVEFLDAAGNVNDFLPDSVATDYLLEPHKFAYLSMDGERPHFIEVDGVWKDNAEWVLQSSGRRVRLSPLWDDKQANEAQAWKKSTDYPEELVEEMKRIFDAM